MRRVIRLAVLSLGLAAPSQAQEVGDCDRWPANARNLARPFEDATRNFANGAISFLHLDTAGEPACCSAWLIVLYPNPEEPFENCALIGRDEASGYFGLSLPEAVADYDPATGLTVRVPASEYDGVHGTPLSLDITVNQQTGELRAAHGAP